MTKMTKKKLFTWVLLAFVAISLAFTAYRAFREDRQSPLTRQAPPVASTAGIPASTAPAAEGSNQILAYYFHGFARCQTCKKLEAYTQEAIATGFGPALKSGRIKWQAINVEEPNNRHFISDFQLTNKSVVLAIARGGAVKDWKNLPKIWELVGDKDRFLKYVQDEVRTYQARL